MITIKVNIEDETREDLADLISALTGEKAAEINEQAGIAARNAAVKYHRKFDQGSGWRGKRYLGPSKNDGTKFGAAVAAGWSLESFDRNGAVISNDAEHYAFKVHGGTITPKSAKFLTIPLIPEARGVRVSRYEQETGNKLFRPKGKRVLMEKTGKGTVRSVYALLDSVTMGPWKDALPPDEDIADAYAQTYLDMLLDR